MLRISPCLTGSSALSARVVSMKNLCVKVEALLHRMHSTDEKLLVVLTCCARLTDAMEAEEQGIFHEIERVIDPLNFNRLSARLSRIA